jgi:hypothetical protein
VVTGLVAWALVVVGVSAITWAVIDAAGQDLLTGSSLVPQESRSRAPRAHVSAAPSHTAAVKPTTAPTAPTEPASRTPETPTTPKPSRTGTWDGPPGAVSVRCAGEGITLVSASPNNGYRIEVDRGAQEIEVHFKSSAREYQVKARCGDGTPTFRVDSDGGEGKDD